MKVTVVVSVFLVGLLAVPSAFALRGKADKCTADKCEIENNCRCSSSQSPLDVDLDELPQLVSLTFNEAVTDNLYDNICKPLLFDYSNPDGEPIGATFFVPHEYTNYQRVNDLYNLGFEIGVNSITKNHLQSYWRGADAKLLEQEFGGQKTILSNFANIPAKDILGARTPQLQLAGNFSITAYRAANIVYDSSWPTLPTNPLFPYTLDYLSTQQCTLGCECPNEAFPGFWILPIIDLRGDGGMWCNNLASCNITGTEDDIANWLTDELDSVRNSSKAPLTLTINSFWFNVTENSFGGFTKFLDNLKNRPDVFLVSQVQVMEWMKNPVPLSEFETKPLDYTANCAPQKCKLSRGEEIITMESCSTCPDVYPWIGNPNGDKQ